MWAEILSVNHQCLSGPNVNTSRESQAASAMAHQLPLLEAMTVEVLVTVVLGAVC